MLVQNGGLRVLHSEHARASGVRVCKTATNGIRRSPCARVGHPAPRRVGAARASSRRPIALRARVIHRWPRITDAQPAQAKGPLRPSQCNAPPPLLTHCARVPTRPPRSALPRPGGRRRQRGGGQGRGRRALWWPHHPKGLPPQGASRPGPDPGKRCDAKRGARRHAPRGRLHRTLLQCCHGSEGVWHDGRSTGKFIDPFFPQVWFKHDLRVSDHPGLLAAAATGR